MGDTGEIDELMRRVSEWEREYGARFSDNPNLDSSGESNAAIANLKRRLDNLGARYHWQASSRSYVLDGIGEPPGGEGAPA
jgi:hypothetical protein